MAPSMILGTKSDNFRSVCHTWCIIRSPRSDLSIRVDYTTFFLNKNPMLIRSRTIMEMWLKKVLTTKTDCNSEKNECSLELNDLPGGATSFEFISKFCYGVKFELNLTNIVGIRCAAEYLRMTEDCNGYNLIYHSENFLQQLLQDWNFSLQVLKSCEEKSVLALADRIKIVSRCIDSLVDKVTQRGNEINFSMVPHCRSKYHSWWYEDISNLSLDHYKRFINKVTQRGGLSPKKITRSLLFYLECHLSNRKMKSGKVMEDIVMLISPFKDNIIFSTKYLLDLLNTAMKLRTNENCLETLEKMVGGQLEHVEVDDLLNITNMGYDVAIMERIVEHFLGSLGSSYSGALEKFATVMDLYLAKVALDENLNFYNFFSLVVSIPDHARPIQDNLYEAIDIFLQAHRYLSDPEREKLCSILNCNKLSLEACMHISQNERLPLRMIKQLFSFGEKIQQRSSLILDKSSTSLKSNQSPQMSFPNDHQHRAFQHALKAIEMAVALVRTTMNPSSWSMLGNKFCQLFVVVIKTTWSIVSRSTLSLKQRK